MSKFYRVKPCAVTYIKLPEDIESDQINLVLSIPKSAKGTFLKIENIVAGSLKTDTPIRENCSPNDCENCSIMYCPVTLKISDFHEVKDKEEFESVVVKRPTIPGHPNCHYGDCYDCHVMTCSIRLGFTEIPKNPSKIE